MCRTASGCAIGALLSIALLAGCGGGDTPGATSRDRFDARRAFQDLRAQVRIGPRPAGSRASKEEVDFIVDRLREAGVRGTVVQHPYRNVVARIPGREAGTVVVAAHHDTKDIPGFVGANDGASGVAVLLELARKLPRPLPGPSVDLVFFDAEEARDDRPFDVDGARGSTQFVRYARHGARQASPPLSEIRAMVLFDLVADCDLGIPREANSDERLYDLFARAASDRSSSDSAAPFVGSAPGVLDDHTPFLGAGIPAVDLIDFDFGPGPTPGAWWHTRQDNLRHVCARSLDA